ncbi:hypothetical protein L2E82_48738 [Cichorium intybus]|uniref:Uncharacterized protein n=1 Tax=Cichorium intybus TaxID=13427 RepID=A0ACB8Z069_CICIN|nr:hypothetical protein L2E82_48738 [Cichorium intybus]
MKSSKPAQILSCDRIWQSMSCDRIWAGLDDFIWILNLVKRHMTWIAKWISNNPMPRSANLNRSDTRNNKLAGLKYPVKDLTSGSKSDEEKNKPTRADLKKTNQSTTDPSNSKPNQTRSKDNKNLNLYSHKNREETRSTTRSDNNEPTRSVNSEPNTSRSSRCVVATNMPPRRLSFLPLCTHRWLTPKPSSPGTGSSPGGWLPPLISSLDFRNRRLSRLPSPLVMIFTRSKEAFF